MTYYDNYDYGDDEYNDSLSYTETEGTKFGSPAGSGAGGPMDFAYAVDHEETDQEVSEDDRVALDEELKRVANDGTSINECYLTVAQTFSVDSNDHRQPMNGGFLNQKHEMAGYHFTSLNPPVFSGQDYNNFCKAVRHWNKVTSMPEKHRAIAVVQAAGGLTHVWKDELMDDPNDLMMSGSLEYVLAFWKSKLLRKGYGEYLIMMEKWIRLHRKPHETSMTRWNERFNVFLQKFKRAHSSAVVIDAKETHHYGDTLSREHGLNTVTVIKQRSSIEQVRRTSFKTLRYVMPIGRNGIV